MAHPLSLAVDCIIGTLLSVVVIVANMGRVAVQEQFRAAIRGFEWQILRHAATAHVQAQEGQGGGHRVGRGGGDGDQRWGQQLRPELQHLLEHIPAPRGVGGGAGGEGGGGLGAVREGGVGRQAALGGGRGGVALGAGLGGWGGPPPTFDMDRALAALAEAARADILEERQEGHVHLHVLGGQAPLHGEGGMAAEHANAHFNVDWAQGPPGAPPHMAGEVVDQPRGVAEGGQEAGQPRGVVESGQEGGQPRGVVEGGQEGGQPEGVVGGGQEGGQPRGVADGGQEAGQPVGVVEGGQGGQQPRGVLHPTVVGINSSGVEGEASVEEEVEEAEGAGNNEWDDGIQVDRDQQRDRADAVLLEDLTLEEALGVRGPISRLAQVCYDHATRSGGDVASLLMPSLLSADIAEPINPHFHRPQLPLSLLKVHPSFAANRNSRYNRYTTPFAVRLDPLGPMPTSAWRAAPASRGPRSAVGPVPQWGYSGQRRVLRLRRVRRPGQWRMRRGGGDGGAIR
eukprot:gene32263-16829_t